MGGVFLLRLIAQVVRMLLRAGRALVTGAERSGRFAAGRVAKARDRGGAGDVGMMRLLDLHAASCAGDALIAVGLAGTIFFQVPTGEARGKVALYLLITMAPFALLAPVVGPVLDRFRHGRRYALATTMLGRAFLAWVISDQMHGWALYPAAFGVLVLSRAYGVARSAAVPRLLPERLGLVEAGARASLFGTVAGALLGGVGVAAAAAGSQWPLRIATVVYVFGMVVALRLPGKADSDPPETVPKIFHVFSRKGIAVLRGRLVWAALAGSCSLRALYGFLTLFLAFRVREGDFRLVVLGRTLPQAAGLGLVAGGLAVGSFLATAVCTRLRIHRPLVLQTAGLAVVAAVAVVSALWYGPWLAGALCLVTAFASGVAKLSVDAVIQERLPERVRASAFSHSETLLMMAFVAGGGLGLVPFAGRVGAGLVAAGVVTAAVRLGVWSAQLRTERLTGVSSTEEMPARPAATTEKNTTENKKAEEQKTEEKRRAEPEPAKTTVRITPDPTRRLAPPGYHLYRPSVRPERPDDTPDDDIDSDLGSEWGPEPGSPSR
jgi:MFS family permease